MYRRLIELREDRDLTQSQISCRKQDILSMKQVKMMFLLKF